MTGAHLVFLPTYSPDLNPAELVFGKVKSDNNTLFHSRHCGYDVGILLQICKVCTVVIDLH